MENRYRLANDFFARETEDEKERALKVFFLSVEGNRTEVEYFTELSKHRINLGINAKIDVEVLSRREKDTNSSLSAVTDLLDEFIELRKIGKDEKGLEKEMSYVLGNQFPATAIKKYLHNSEGLAETQREKISVALQTANYDIIYRRYLSNRSSENDEFGIVIDRDRQAHKKEGLIACLQHCKEHNYQCYITNPCFEFWLLLHLADVSADYRDQLGVILKNRRNSHQHTYVSKEVSLLAGHGKGNINFEVNYLPNVDLAIERAKSFESDAYQIIDKLGTNLWQLIERLRNFEI